MTTARTVHGADVSHHQGTLDLPAAKKAGLQFLWHKATEGNTLKDAEYAGRRAAAAKAGVPFGAYHFARPDVGDAAVEATFFVKTAQPKPGDLLPALDLETTEGLTLTQLKVWARTFAETVERLTGFDTALYCPWDLGLGLVRWVPRYNRDNRLPAVPWDIWQFSGGAEFPGTPSTFPGLGAVDLNTFRQGFGLGHIVIPKPEVKPPKPPRAVNRVRMSHISMQFSDTPAQMRSDATKIFKRARAKGVRWITGTEAGGKSGPDMRSALTEAANDAGFRFFFKGGDSWIAVDRNFFTGDLTSDYVKVLDGEAGKYTDKGILSVSGDTPLGRVSVLTTHYLTKGKPNAPASLSMNLPENRLLAKKIGEMAARLGSGAALVFYGGDQNISDATDDTFLSHPMTSLWDEIGRYENTGHGPIDVIATYDKDGRVKAASIQALDDREFFLHTDHFLVEGAVDVAVPRS